MILQYFKFLPHHEVSSLPHCQKLSYQHSLLVCLPGFVSFIKHFYSRQLLIFLQRALSSPKLREISLPPKHWKFSDVKTFLHMNDFSHQFFTCMFGISQNLIFNVLKCISIFALSPCRQSTVWNLFLPSRNRFYRLDLFIIINGQWLQKLLLVSSGRYFLPWEQTSCAIKVRAKAQ